jgi:hypothetical protein
VAGSEALAAQRAPTVAWLRCLLPYALTATAGHHWIIEDCEVGYANTIGIDL